MPQLYDEAARKRRKGGTTGFSSQPEAPIVHEPTYDRVGRVERESKGTLPTGVAWALSQIPLEDKRLRRAVRLTARDLDVPWSFLFGKTDPRKLIDPVTGQKGLSAATIHRLTNRFTPAAIASLLGSQAAGEEHREAARHPVDPVRVGKFATALVRHLPAHEIDGVKAIALAGSLSRTPGVTAKVFEQNLARIAEWAKGGDLAWNEIAYIAVRATRDKRRFASTLDVVKYLVGPNVEQAVEQGENLEAALLAEQTAGNRAIRPEEKNLSGFKQSAGELGLAPLMMVREMVKEPSANDLFANAQELEEQIRLERTAFQRSWLGKALDTAIKPFNWIAEKGQEGIIELAGAVKLVQGGVGAAFTDKTLKDAWDNSQALRHRWHARLNNGDWLGSQIAHDSGAPEFVGVGLDFAIGWYLDPFVLGGKALKGLRGPRVAPGVLEPSVTVRTILRPGERIARLRGEEALGRYIVRQAEREAYQWADFYDSAAAFAKSRDSHKLLQMAMGEAGGTRKFLARLDELRTNYSASHPLPFEYMKAVRDKIRQRFPGRAWNDPEVKAAWEEAVGGAFGIRPSPGSVGDEAGRLIAGQQAGLREKLAQDLADLPEGAGAQAREAIEAITHDPFLLPMGLEVPQFRFLGGLPGPRRLIRRAATSDMVQATKIGRRVSRLGVYHPERWLNYHANPDVTAYEVSRFYRQSEERARYWQSRILEAKNQGPGFEDRIDEIFEELNREGITDIAKPYNLDQDTLDAFIEANLRPIREQNLKLQAFGVEEVATEQGGALTAVTRPLFESQRKNYSFLIDPIEVETRLQQMIGAPRRAQQAFFRALDKVGIKNIPELSADLARLQSRTVRFQESLRSVGRAYLRLWKAGTVARPAYITRVVLLDEQLRFLATTGSLTERLAAQRTFGRLLEPIAQREVKIGDEVVRLSLPSHHGYEPLASNSTRQAEILTETARRSKATYDALAKGPGWDVLDALQAPDRHLLAWKRALTHDIANSDSGRLALEAIAEGKNFEETVTILRSYAREPANFARLQRNGIVRGADDIDRWADQVAQVTHAYTMAGTKAQRNIAAAAMAQSDDLGDLLKIVKVEDRPPVHGPMVDDIMLGNLGTSLHTSVVDGLYGAMVRVPEDVLNRQPFYRVWKSRAENAYLGHLQQVYAKNPEMLRQIREGVEAKLWPSAARGEFIETSDQLEALFRANEDDYWYHQTKADPASLGKTGLEPRFRFEADGTVRPWEGGGREQRLYFAPAPEFSTYLTDLEAGPMLRIKRSAVPDVQPGMFAVGEQPVEYFAKAKVAGKDIEFFGVDGAWHPLSDAAKTVLKPHPYQQAVNIASRNFALDQVKKIMFDFTRQSRFSELLKVAFPFPQPFFEGFQAWGHLAVRNPGIIGRARTLFKLGQDSGLVFQDEDGEWRVKMGIYAAAARKLHILDERLAKSLSFTAPLDSFNMLSQSSIHIPADAGILSKAVGGVAVPMPGLHPPLMLALQRWFENDPSATITGYLFQYGPQSPLIPAPVRKVLTAVRKAIGFETDIDEERLRAVSGEIMKEYQRLGLGVDADGNPLSDSEVAAMAREDAIDLIVSQDLVSLLSPGALSASLGHDSIEDEFNRRIEKDGASSAYNWLTTEHPNMTLIGIGKTYFTGAYRDKNDDPVSAGRPPSSEFFSRLVAQKDFRSFARNHPEWVALLALGIGQDVSQDFDMPTYARQIRAGVLSYKRPEDFWAAGEDAKAWQKWYEWRRDHWVPSLESLPEAVEEDDPAYTQLKARRREFLTQVAVEHPGWARRHLQQDADGNWDFGYDPDTGPASTLEVLADARAIVATKGFERFPGVQALRAYLDGRDDLEERMRAEGIRNVYDSEKLRGELERLKADAVALVPEEDQSTMERMLDEYFKGDLTNILSYQDRSLSGKRFDEVLYHDQRRDTDVTLRDAVVDYDTKIEVLSKKAQDQYETSWERSQRYQDIRSYIDGANPKIIKAWWRLSKPAEQAEYRQTLRTRPAVFWSSFDWEVMGVKLDNEGKRMLNEIGEARIEIQRRENENPVDFSESDAYDRLDKVIALWKKQNKTFATAIDHASDWTFPLTAGPDPLTKRTNTGAIWSELADALRVVQGIADKRGWLGIDYGEERDRRDYSAVQTAIEGWIREQTQAHPAFEAEWNELKAALGGPLIEDLLMPNSYFGRYGSV